MKRFDHVWMSRVVRPIINRIEKITGWSPFKMARPFLVLLIINKTITTWHPDGHGDALERFLYLPVTWVTLCDYLETFKAEQTQTGSAFARHRFVWSLEGYPRLRCFLTFLCVPFLPWHIYSLWLKPSVLEMVPFTLTFILFAAYCIDTEPKSPVESLIQKFVRSIAAAFSRPLGAKV